MHPWSRAFPDVASSVGPWVLALFVGVTGGLAGCGGSSAQSPVQEPAPTVQEPPRPAAVDTARMRLMWLVHWHNIHVLTVYPTPGLIASTRRSADNPAPPPFGTRSRAFSAVSVHRDSEPWMAEVLAGATSLDALLAAFAEREHVEVTEVDNDAIP